MPTRRLVTLDAPDPLVVPRRFEDRETALAWCEAERTTLAAVIRAASDRGRHRQAHQLAMQLGGYYNLRKYWNDWITTFTVAIGAAEHDSDDDALAWLLTSIGIATRDVRRFDESVAVLERALPLFAAYSDRIGEFSAMNNLGSTLLEAGHADLARSRFGAVADGYTQAGMAQPRGRSLSNLGTARTALGHHDDAVATIGRGLDLLREAEDIHGVGFTLHNLGEAHLAAGTADAAELAFREALQLRIETGNVWGEARTRLGIGKTLLGQGRPDEALRELEAAYELFETHGTPVDTAHVALAMAQALGAIGDVASARKALFQATWLLGPVDQDLANELGAALDAMGGP